MLIEPRAYTASRAAQVATTMLIEAPLFAGMEYAVQGKNIFNQPHWVAETIWCALTLGTLKIKNMPLQTWFKGPNFRYAMTYLPTWLRPIIQNFVIQGQTDVATLLLIRAVQEGYYTGDVTVFSELDEAVGELEAVVGGLTLSHTLSPVKAPQVLEVPDKVKEKLKTELVKPREVESTPEEVEATETPTPEIEPDDLETEEDTIDDIDDEATQPSAVMPVAQAQAALAAPAPANSAPATPTAVSPAPANQAPAVAPSASAPPAEREEKSEPPQPSLSDRVLAAFNSRYTALKAKLQQQAHLLGVTATLPTEIKTAKDLYALQAIVSEMLKKASAPEKLAFTKKATARTIRDLFSIEGLEVSAIQSHYTDIKPTSILAAEPISVDSLVSDIKTASGDTTINAQTRLADLPTLKGVWAELLDTFANKNMTLAEVATALSATSGRTATISPVITTETGTRLEGEAALAYAAKAKSRWGSFVELMRGLRGQAKPHIITGALTAESARPLLAQALATEGANIIIPTRDVAKARASILVAMRYLQANGIAVKATSIELVEADITQENQRNDYANYVRQKSNGRLPVIDAALAYATGLEVPLELAQAELARFWKAEGLDLTVIRALSPSRPAVEVSATDKAQAKPTWGSWALTKMAAMAGFPEGAIKEKGSSFYRDAGVPLQGRAYGLAQAIKSLAALAEFCEGTKVAEVTLPIEYTESILQNKSFKRDLAFAGLFGVNPADPWLAGAALVPVYQQAITTGINSTQPLQLTLRGGTETKPVGIGPLTAGARAAQVFGKDSLVVWLLGGNPSNPAPIFERAKTYDLSQPQTIPVETYDIADTHHNSVATRATILEDAISNTLGYSPQDLFFNIQTYLNIRLREYVHMYSLAQSDGSIIDPGVKRVETLLDILEREVFDFFVDNPNATEADIPRVIRYTDDNQSPPASGTQEPAITPAQEEAPAPLTSSPFTLQANGNSYDVFDNSGIKLGTAEIDSAGGFTYTGKFTLDGLFTIVASKQPDGTVLLSVIRYHGASHDNMMSSERRTIPDVPADNPTAWLQARLTEIALEVETSLGIADSAPQAPTPVADYNIVHDTSRTTTGGQQNFSLQKQGTRLGNGNVNRMGGIMYTGRLTPNGSVFNINISHLVGETWLVTVERMEEGTIRNPDERRLIPSAEMNFNATPEAGNLLGWAHARIFDIELILRAEFPDLFK
ncbi:hypothetical protein K1X76_07910 [bacterium]|nr:hypothetical protein [bacterium]